MSESRFDAQRYFKITFYLQIIAVIAIISLVFVLQYTSNKASVRAAQESTRQSEENGALITELHEFAEVIRATQLTQESSMHEHRERMEYLIRLVEDHTGTKPRSGPSPSEKPRPTPSPSPSPKPQPSPGPGPQPAPSPSPTPPPCNGMIIFGVCFEDPA